MSAFRLCATLGKEQAQILRKYFQVYGTVTKQWRLSSGCCNLPSIYHIHKNSGLRCFSTLVVNPVKLNRTSVNFLVRSTKTNFGFIRFVQTSGSRNANERKNYVYYTIAAMVFMLGMSYMAVPLYRMFCQATGLGGQSFRGHNVDQVDTMSPVPDRKIAVMFNADVASSMRWNFRPQQPRVDVVPGETALAFYTARNPTDTPVIGISTYNVVPYEAAIYFNKIQCFCFEEQLLNPHEQVDMPVFFYIDPDFAKDPKLKYVDQITLSYTFFEAKHGLELPLPGFPQPHSQAA